MGGGQDRSQVRQPDRSLRRLERGRRGGSARYGPTSARDVGDPSLCPFQLNGGPCPGRYVFGVGPHLVPSLCIRAAALEAAEKTLLRASEGRLKPRPFWSAPQHCFRNLFSRAASMP